MTPGRSSEASGKPRLTDKQSALINAIVDAAERGVELTREEAGTLAGYGTGDSARVQCSRSLALPYVRDALVERMRNLAAMDAPAAYATLRHVRRHGGIGHRLNAAIETLKIAGVRQDEGAGGPAMVINLILDHGIGTSLTHVSARVPQVIDVPSVSEGEHRLDEAEGTGPSRRATKAQGGRGGAGVPGGVAFAREESEGAGSPHTSPPKRSASKKSLSKKSAVRKPRGGKL